MFLRQRFIHLILSNSIKYRLVSERHENTVNFRSYSSISNTHFTFILTKGNTCMNDAALGVKIAKTFHHHFCNRFENIQWEHIPMKSLFKHPQRLP